MLFRSRDDDVARADVNNDNTDINKPDGYTDTVK